jgi:hypothetical protein
LIVEVSYASSTTATVTVVGILSVHSGELFTAIRKNISKRKLRWFEELKQERERDINIEMSEKGY